MVEQHPRPDADHLTDLLRSSADEHGRSRHLGGRAQSVLANLPRRSNGAGRVVVLCYHSVHPSNSYTSATPQLFGRHLQWLKQHCDVVPFAGILDHIDAKSSKPVVALTFDDGYRDNFTAAFPSLLEYGLPATFFVTTGLIERDASVMSHIAKDLATSVEELTPLTWEQIREMQDSGMEIGAHTLTHPNLAQQSEDEAFRELAYSKELLEEQLSSPVESLAYPYGVPRRHFSQATMRLAQRSGYKRGAAILFRKVRASDSAFAIPRLAITRDSLEMLRAKIIGNLDLVGVWQEHAPQWAARIVSSPESRRV
jgi:peptidoglycan/xylan/chitin deacetylase (PgdA/CDA1 family)